MSHILWALKYWFTFFYTLVAQFSENMFTSGRGYHISANNCLNLCLVSSKLIFDVCLTQNLAWKAPEFYFLSYLSKGVAIVHCTETGFISLLYKQFHINCCKITHKNRWFRLLCLGDKVIWLVNFYTLKNLKWTGMAIPFWMRIYVICFLSEMYFLFYFIINAVVSL